MMRGGRWPSSAPRICSAAIRPILARASWVTPAVCGLASTLSNCSSGWSGAGDALIAKRFEQRVLVVDKAAGGRDEIGMRLHSREFAGADHAAIIFRQRTGNRHIIRTA